MMLRADSWQCLRQRHGSPHPSLDRMSMALYWYLISSEDTCSWSPQNKIWFILLLVNFCCIHSHLVQWQVKEKFVFRTCEST